MAVYRLDFGGDLYADIWACRIHLNGELDQDLDLWDEVNVKAALDDIQADLTTWWNANSFTPQSNLKWLKLNEINPDSGKYVSKSITIGQEWDPIAGKGGTSQAPQLSLALSWHTAVKRGRGSKGRIYPPPASMNYGTDGQVAQAIRAEHAAAAAALIANLNNWPGIDKITDLNCIVLGLANEARATETGDDSYLQHVKNNITHVAVGSVLDTQRRRRSALREQYEKIAIG